MPLVECIPNFSEGRSPEIVAAIVDAIRTSGVYLLDVSSDYDHNRTVVTFAGDPDTVGEGAFRGIEAAANLIDLRLHSGEHPRIGAADVVPFVPLRDFPMDACVELARRVGERTGRELQIPVYLYDYAAQHPERRTLPQVRRDPYEILTATIQSDPSRQPDFGPHYLGPAGAVAIGARGPLIAFNIFLDTEDVNIAKTIAAKIRESGGGLPKVRALGLFVGGHAQVSINAVDFRVTGLHAILDAVRHEAKALGVSITHSELVGLIPQNALANQPPEALQLPAYAADLILEKRLGQFTGDFRPLTFD
jgi:glutamate formiminotransferase